MQFIQRVNEEEKQRENEEKTHQTNKCSTLLYGFCLF